MVSAIDDAIARGDEFCLSFILYLAPPRMVKAARAPGGAGEGWATGGK